MRSIQRLFGVLILSALVAFGATSASALDILLTNDDGYNSPGITTMKAALEARGHTVTIVAPLENQSGKGGSLNTNVFSTVAVVQQSPGVWSVDSTPADSIRAAVGVVLQGTPDLVVSGSNFGQNLSRTGTQGSGTVNAALQGMFSGIPAIAVSVGVLFQENPTFGSTFAAFPLAAEFTARLIADLEATANVGGNANGGLLPPNTVLNVNIPVPYGDIEGVKLTTLADEGNLEFTWSPAGPGLALVGIDFAAGQGEDADTDTGAFLDDYIAITPISGNMTSQQPVPALTKVRLPNLEP